MAEVFLERVIIEARCKTQNLRAHCRAAWWLICTGNAAAAAPAGCETARIPAAAEKPLMQIFANLLRWLVQGGARKAHVKRADDLLKKLSRSLSSK